MVDGGKIAEEGTHEELLAKGGVYRELYETQFRTVIDYESAEERAVFDPAVLSTELSARALTEADISDVYRLCRENRRYYRYTGTKPSMRGLTAVISEVPEGTPAESKHFVGFYDADGHLTAILDLITGYPEEDDAFIGWFMVDAKEQGKGIGSQLFADIRAALKGLGYDYLSLETLRDNTEALEFWEKQGFSLSGKESEQYGKPSVILERDI